MMKWAQKANLLPFYSKPFSLQLSDYNDAKHKEAVGILDLRLYFAFHRYVSGNPGNIDNSNFRRILIGKVISDADFERALMLCLDGEEKDKSYSGLVSQWKQFRYDIYEKTKDTEAQKILAKEFLLEGTLSILQN